MASTTLRFIAALLLLPALSAAAAPQSAGYTITDLGEMPPSVGGQRYPGAAAINDKGQVVGGDGQAFLWS